MEQSFGAVLSGLRKEREMSLRELGQRTRFSHVYLWQIERGEKRPTARVAEACDRELRAGGELLALLAEPVGTPSPAGRSTVSEAGEARSASSGPGVSPDSTAAALWEVRDRFERLYREVGGVCTRPRLNEFLRTRAMPAADGPDARPETVAAVAAMQALAAACAHDCLDRKAAHPHARYALVLAQRSGQLPMVGYALSLRARFELWTGRAEIAAEHVERALAMRKHLDPALLSDLHCLHARTHVRRGDVGAAREALLDAARLVESGDPSAGPPQTRYLVAGTLETRRAEVLRRAGDLDEAVDHARVAQVIGGTGYPRARVHAWTVHARVLADRGDIEQAESVGLAAMDLVERMESRLLTRRLESLGRACVEVDPTLLHRAQRLLRWLS